MFKQIVPADGWFFVTREAETEKLMVFPIAVWALAEDGESVVGLVGDMPTGGGQLGIKTPKLTGLPPMMGMYKHLSTLSDEEKSKIDGRQRFLTR